MTEILDMSKKGEHLFFKKGTRGSCLASNPSLVAQACFQISIRSCKRKNYFVFALKRRENICHLFHRAHLQALTYRWEGHCTIPPSDP